MKTIVVTGGMGSGKTLACGILRRKGIPVYDSDSKVKEIYAREPSIAALVTKEIFADELAMRLLESRLYPVLMDDFRQWAAEKQTEYVAFESAILLQKDFFDGFGDYVVLIDAPYALRLERAMSRGTVEKDSVIGRMKLQRDERLNPRVNYIIENDASEKELEAEIDKFLESINYGKGKN